MERRTVLLQHAPTGELIPWMATDFEYDDGYTGVTVNIRDGVTWSDRHSVHYYGERTTSRSP